MFGDQILNGLAFGSIYILVAAPLLLQFGILRIVNLAFGEVFALATFGAIVSMGFCGSYVAVGVLGAALSALAAGWAIQRFVEAPLGNVSDPKSAAHLNCLVATMGCTIVMQNGLIAIFGANPLPFPTGSSPGGLLGGGQLMFLVGSALSVVALLHVLLNYTSLGVELRAVAEDRGLAAASGINVRRVQWVAIGISYFSCGIVAFVVARYLSFTSAYAGVGYGLKALIILVVAGNKGFTRLCAVAFALGIVEALAVGYGSSQYRDAFGYGVLFLLIQGRTLMGLRRGFARI